jgi:hypothetical protein
MCSGERTGSPAGSSLQASHVPPEVDGNTPQGRGLDASRMGELPNGVSLLDCRRIKAVFDEMVSGGLAAWITTGMPAVCSLLAVAYVVTAEGGKHLIRLTHPFVLFLLPVFFLILTVMAGTVFWLVAEFFAWVVVLIAHSLPQRSYVNQAPPTTAVFALTWTMANLVVEEFIDSRLPNRKK